MEERAFPALLCAGVGLILSPVCSLECHKGGRTSSSSSVSYGGPGKGFECKRQEEQLRPLDLHSFRKRRLKGDFPVLSSLLRGSKGAGAHPFSQTPRARTRPTAIAGSCLLTSSSLTGSSLTGLLGTEAGSPGKRSQSQICCRSLSLWTRLSDTWLPLEGVLCRARS